MYLGIDLGTSGVKIIIIDEEDRLIAQASSPLVVNRPSPLWSEQNPRDWWQATQLAISELHKGYAESLNKVKAIGLSGQCTAQHCLIIKTKLSDLRFYGMMVDLKLSVMK
jgi:xylulokinase